MSAPPPEEQSELIPSAEPPLPDDQADWRLESAKRARQRAEQSRQKLEQVAERVERATQRAVAKGDRALELGTRMNARLKRQ